MSGDLPTSKTLILRIQDNDEDAWARFHEIYHAYLYCVIRSMRIEHEDAVEIVQDVLVRVWKGIGRFDLQRRDARFRTWLTTITRRCVLDFIDKRKRRIGNSGLVVTPDLKEVEDFVAGTELDALAEREWRTFLTNLAMERAATHFRGQAMDVFKAAMSGEATGQIAKRLGIAPDTVTRLKNRVRHRVGHELSLLRHELE